MVYCMTETGRFKHMTFHDNLPPGVSVGDLPGNTPADIAFDTLVTRLVQDLDNLIDEVAGDEGWDEAELREAVYDAIS